MSTKAHVTVGVPYERTVGYQPFVYRYNFTHANLGTGGTYQVPVLPGTTVLMVGIRIKTAFNSGVDCKVGDAANDAGYIALTDIDPTSPTFVTSLGKTAPFAQGKHYAANNRIIATFTGTPTAGEAELFIMTLGTEGRENI